MYFSSYKKIGLKLKFAMFGTSWEKESAMTLRGVFVILIITVLSSCSSESDSWSPTDPQNKISIAMPTAKNSQLPHDQGIWRAFVTIPDARDLICDTPIDADTCELTIEIAENRATAQIQLATGTYSPQIVWEYQDATFSNPIRQDGFWSIANARKQLTIEGGKNTPLTFSVDDYKPLPDDDEDGMSNLAELEDRTDPSDSNEPPRESVCLAQMTQYFTFEEDTPPYTDIIGGSSANCTNCPTVTQGQVGMGLRFDGTNEIDVPDNGQFDWELGDEFSIEYWMNSTSDCNGGNGRENEVIVGRQGPTHPNPHMWVGCTGGVGLQGLAVFVLIDVDGGRGGDGNDDWPRSNSLVTDGEWHHIVAVKTKTHIHLYVDGVKNSSVAKTYTAGFASTTPLNIGYLNLGDRFHYNGDLDEVAYYRKALTGEEVMEHFNRGRMLGEGYCDKRRR